MLACQNTPVVTDTLTEAEVLDFIARYDQAWNAKDTQTVNTLLSPAYLYFDSQGGLTTRERNLEILGADYYQILSAQRSELQVKLDGNVATVSSRWEGNGTWKGEEFRDNQRCGLTLLKQKGKIHLLNEHCIPIKQ